MDPISLIASIAGIVGGVGAITKGLFDLTRSYQDLPQTYKHTINECFIINGALSRLQERLTLSDGQAQWTQGFVQLDLLVNTVAATRETFLQLDEIVNDLAGSKSKTTMGLKYLWKEKEISDILVRLQQHANGLNLILNILQR
ncbi:hypothetical protein ABW19_dt0205766 [Dactylella cylindrospora]|nr:hypothetical protein ABW19_dt0205766 [Dactylella cylindrospora]